MRESLRHLARAGLVLGGLGVSGTAFALPWNLDMVDAQMVKAYEQPMRPLPEGVMSQPHLLTPVAWRENYSWTSDARTTLTNPVDADEAALATGEKMYATYCTPCHGNGVELGPVSEKGYPAVAILAGADGRLQNQPDGHVYLTIRNGSLSKLMPSYGYAMTDQEIWSLVAWMRADLPNATYKAPVATPATPAE